MVTKKKTNCEASEEVKQITVMITIVIVIVFR